MPNFRYRALTESGEVVSGIISAPNAAEVSRRIDYLRLVPIDQIVEQGAARPSAFNFTLGQKARSEDVTIFTMDLALLLKAGARLDEALELLATDIDIGRLRSSIAAVRSCVLTGESFADAITHHPTLFPSMYVALVRVGEASGMLEHILEVLARERTRAEASRRKLADALRYPAFVLCAAACVLVFFLMFVLPQFSAVLHDFDAKIDPVAGMFIGLSEFTVAHKEAIGIVFIFILMVVFFAARHPKLRTALLSRLARLPIISSIATYHQTALFCRNLGVLLSSAVPLTTALRILAEIMAALGGAAVWVKIVEQVRHGGKLSEALRESETLPAMAVRMLRLGEESGHLAELSGRVADFYETKLERSLDRVVALVGPLAIVGISIVVGGLIVSVMTSLLSVSQLVG